MIRLTGKNKQLTKTTEEVENVALGADDEPNVQPPKLVRNDAKQALFDVNLNANIDLPKYLHGSKLDDILPNYKTLRKELKNKSLLNEWKEKINGLLLLYNANDNKYDFNLLNSVMQIVEDHLIYSRKCGATKKAIVMEIMMPFFNNDNLLLSNAIENSMHLLIQSSFMQRMIKRVYFFLF